MVDVDRVRLLKISMSGVTVNKPDFIGVLPVWIFPHIFSLLVVMTQQNSVRRILLNVFYINAIITCDKETVKMDKSVLEQYEKITFERFLLQLAIR